MTFNLILNTYVECFFKICEYQGGVEIRLQKSFDFLCTVLQFNAYSKQSEPTSRWFLVEYIKNY